MAGETGSSSNETEALIQDPQVEENHHNQQDGTLIESIAGTYTSDHLWEERGQSSNEATEPSINSQLDTVREGVRNMDEQVKKLCEQITDVAEVLSLRTSRAVNVTVSHAATTEALAKEAHASVGKLDETTRVFLKDVESLRSHFNILNVLAKETADVRSALTTLEMEVAKMTARRSSKDLGLPSLTQR